MDLSTLIHKYADALQEQYLSGHAKEHAYRPALKDLLSNIGDVVAVNDPKRSQHGNPDFIFLKRSNPNIILGYAEAKDIDGNLEKTERGEQLRRYAGYDNLFLTNYLEFRFLKNGGKYETIAIGSLDSGRIDFQEDQFERLGRELQAFLSKAPESMKSGKRLAEIMGAKAIRIRENIRIYLEQDNERNEELDKIHKMICALLVRDLSEDRFADLYAQTLVYGLFIARYNDTTRGSFSRIEARELIPDNNPFLREFFDHIAGPRFDTRLAHIVDELCEIYSVSDVNLLVQKHLRLFEVENDKDPIIHFYEDFLREYDPAQRKAMGAYYTPLPIVQFMIRQVDEVLKHTFGITDGIASAETKQFMVTSQNMKSKGSLHRVQILDPATGTATFLNEIIRFIYKGFVGQEGRWPSYVERDLLPRLYGFELMMAPYTIAHLKLGMTLQEAGVKTNQRLKVYLTNTLEEGIKKQPDLFAFGLADAVAKEAQAAAVIKHEKPIMVIIGNPPYSGVSSNETEYAKNLITKYKVEPGGKQKLQERKHWLNDDYVKFIAFAEEMIAKNGEGIVAMITNHGYLDNPTFRGMRWHLSKTFNEIYVLDLHGNAKKKEVSPDGSKDENVFDIQQGVAIIIGIKTGEKKSNSKVFHAELFGARKEKFKALGKSLRWTAVKTDPRMWYFVPKNTEGQQRYEKGISIADLFIKSSTGIVTARDSVVIDFERESLANRIKKFIDFSSDDEQTRSWLFPKKKNGKYLAGDSRGWKLIQARQRVVGEDIEEHLQRVTYRPFDNRWIYYSPNMVDWDRFDVMQHFVKGRNLGLISVRQPAAANPLFFDSVFITNEMLDLNFVRRGSAQEFPLWLNNSDGSKTANFRPDAFKLLTKNLISTPGAEQVLDYVYAVLFSPKYRRKYAEFLKTDFPRIPIPLSEKTFCQLTELGNNLRQLHLMTSPALNSLMTTFPIRGSNEVERVVYDDGNIWINDIQYFGEVPEVAWNFYIGGYQPAQKWLKDRKGRELSSEDIIHYQKIIISVIETHKVMQQIDEVVDL